MSRKVVLIGLAVFVILAAIWAVVVFLQKSHTLSPAKENTKTLPVEERIKTNQAINDAQTVIMTDTQVNARAKESEKIEAANSKDTSGPTVEERLRAAAEISSQQ